MEFTPDSDGEYRIRVSSTLGSTGEYRLFLDEKRVPPFAPPAPSLLSYDSSLIVSWDPPSDNGNSPVTSYDLRHIPSDSPDKGDANWTVIDTAGEPDDRLRYEITGLANGTEYDVQVRAVNAKGDGAWSETAAETPQELVDQAGNWCVLATTSTLSCDLTQTGRLVVGTVSTGEIGEEGAHWGDADWFRVKLLDGKMYRIDALGAPSGDGTLADPYLRGMYAVYRGEEYRDVAELVHHNDKVVSVWHRWAPPPGDPGEELVRRSQYNDDGGLGWNARLYLRGFAEGEYFVEVTGVDSGGTYQLTITEVEDDDPDIRSLALGVPAGGELDFPKDGDVFEVTLTANTEYEVRVGPSPTGSGWDDTRNEWPRIAGVTDVTDADNPTEVTCESDRREQRCTFTASEAGAYRITVSGHVNSGSKRTHAVGPYELTVTAR